MTEITLKHPITLDGRQYGKLSLRRPRVRDILAASKTMGGDAEKEATMFANLCEVDPNIVNELDIADYKQLQDIYQSFLS
ncbi:phage tail assembly protein [Candidatus Regiella insecticola]|uniref:Phage tail assembly chaperone proteins n=1 Tax=Candidatus Regiella insecticola TaxID=138073 RepID=A0A6L2ZPB5_9ENTR|nr:phage tail assembly protein [Candidatus Regiella insecticola]GFN46369.1 phage tail assembly chaperone proteins [Candidatus Regiella insecticola]